VHRDGWDANARVWRADWAQEMQPATSDNQSEQRK
jgi:hypothetical protein